MILYEKLERIVSMTEQTDLPIEVIIEKQIPKYPILSRIWATTPDKKCPNCKENIIGAPAYCEKCGQRINWSLDWSHLELYKVKSMSKMKLIPIKERDPIMRCFFCKSNKSVKYSAKTENPCKTAENRYIDILVCNKCALVHNDKLVGE